LAASSTSSRITQTRAPAAAGHSASSRWLLCLAFVIIALLAGLLIGHGDLLLVFGTLAIVATTLIAWRWPLIPVGLVLLAVGGYTIFQMTPGFVAKALYFGSPVAVQDIALVGMCVAAAARLTSGGAKRRTARLLAPILAVSAWLILGVLRNSFSVGLSASGELRFRYLSLAVPLYLLVSLRSPRQTRGALMVFASVAVGLPVVLSPVVLSLKGWSFGWQDRLFPSQVSLGLLMGLITLWYCRSWIRVPRLVLYAATVLGGLEIVFDAHRSVWLAAIAALVVLALSRRGPTTRARQIALVAVGLLALVLLALFTPLDVWSTFSERGGEALAIEGTARWRQLVWEASLQQFSASPLVGRGFGLYWSVYVGELGGEVTTFPHSLYVMILAHLGVVGMLLFLWLFFAALRALFRVRKNSRPADFLAARPDELAWLGMAALAASAAYGIAYGFDPYSLTLVGICLSAAIGAGASRYEPKRRDGTIVKQGPDDSCPRNASEP
jgi:O-antigen ligase